MTNTNKNGDNLVKSFKTALSFNSIKNGTMNDNTINKF